MVQDMCFWEGKTKAREVRAQEESVDALSPGSLSVGVRSATQSIIVSMTSGGYGWEGVIEAPTTQSQTIFKSRTHDLFRPPHAGYNLQRVPRWLLMIIDQLVFTNALLVPSVVFRIKDLH